MRIVFKKGKQNEFFVKYQMAKKISWRAISRTLNVNWRTFRFWRDGDLTLPKEIYLKLISDLPELLQFKKYILEEREDKWWRTTTPMLGWKAVEKKLKTDKNFREEWRKKCKLGGIKAVSEGYIKGWDVGFRKVSRRKTRGPKGELMFNEKEKSIAEFFSQNNIKYKYEPMIKINSHIYFPDFCVGSKLIERCGLWSKKYSYDLKRKLKNYKIGWKGKIILVTTQKMFRRLKKIIPNSNKFIVVNENRLEELKKYLGR